MTLTTNVRSKLACVTTAALMFPLLAPATASAAAMAPKATQEMSFWDAMSGGEAWLRFRPRYEYSSQDNALTNANAFTMRTILGYKTAQFKGFDALLEFANVTNLSKNKNYNDNVAGTAGYSVVADPGSTVVNQAVLNFHGLQDTKINLGRQVINLDTDRFVGDVGWRQTAQRYDSVMMTNTSLANTKATYIYAWGVERIFGVAAVGNAKRYDAATHLVNVAFEPAKWGKFVPYAYLINNKNQAYSSSDTYGLRFTGESPEYSNGISAIYTAEYATQKGAHNNTSTTKFNFMNFELGAKNQMFSALVGYEFLGGNGTNAFVTPYSTIHKFNGWADLFINQNPTTSNALNGIKDTYLGLTANMYDIKATARYHDFRADSVNMHYGNELDLSVSKSFNKNVNVLAKFADYRKKDSNAANTTINTKKFWLQTSVSFN